MQPSSSGRCRKLAQLRAELRRKRTVHAFLETAAFEWPSEMAPSAPIKKFLDRARGQTAAKTRRSLVGAICRKRSRPIQTHRCRCNEMSRALRTGRARQSSGLWLLCHPRRRQVGKCGEKHNSDSPRGPLPPGRRRAMALGLLKVQPEARQARRRFCSLVPAAGNSFEVMDDRSPRHVAELWR